MSFYREKSREVLNNPPLDKFGRITDQDIALDRLADCVTPDEQAPRHSDGALVTNAEFWDVHDDLTTAEAKVAAVLALHDGPNSHGVCDECSMVWPCATAQACGVTT